MQAARSGPGSTGCARPSGRAESSCPHLPGDGLGAHRATRPAADDAREQTGAAAGVRDQQTTVAELRQGDAGEALGEPLLDAVGAAHELVPVELEQRAELLAKASLAPARLGVHPQVLG